MQTDEYVEVMFVYKLFTMYYNCSSNECNLFRPSTIPLYI